MKKPLVASEQVTFWRADVIYQKPQLELLRASYVTHTFAPHMHDTFVAGMVEQGAETFAYRGEKHIAPRDSIVLINPAEVHTGSAVTESGWTYRTFYPDPALLQQIASEQAGHSCDVPFFPRAVVYDRQTARNLQTLHRTLETSPSSLERSSLLIATFAALIARHAEQPRTITALKNDHRAIEQVRDYLHAHFSENVLLEQLANLAQMSPYYLLRLFQQSIGLSPHAYLTQLRVAHARKLLIVGVPIVQVALDVGFADQSHLTRHFKRLVGVTPGQYVPRDKIVQDSHTYLL